MKRYLKHNRYRLDDHEAERMWYRIRGEFVEGSTTRAPRRTSFRPALTVAAVLVLLVVVVAWRAGSRRPASPYPGGLDVVVHEEIPETPAVRKPAAPPRMEPATEVARPRAAETRAVVPPAAASPTTGAAVPPAVTLAESGRTEVVPDRSGVIAGRVIDGTDSTAVAFANVLLVGTTRGAATDSGGAFRFEHLEPGRRYELQVVMLGYEPLDVSVEVPADGQAAVACALEPVVVATLQAFDVAGAEYRVEIKNAMPEQAVRGETYEKFAFDRVAEAPPALGRVEMRAGEAFSLAERAGGGSVTGGTTPPNGETFELMYFEHVGVNPFVSTDEDPLSTFALDVDNASFTLARNYLDRGVLPPAAAVRVEEFVNALDAGWPESTKDTFCLHVDGGPSRFGQGYHLLHIGVVGRTVSGDNRKPANLVFVIDVSGSMHRESRLGAVKRALRTLVDELGEGDRVGIVVYGSRGEVRLPLTDVSGRETIFGVIDELQPGGSTNAAEGLELGYRLARENYDAGVINRVILCSDGVANTGDATDAEGILGLVRRASDEGITLSTVGFGMGNYNDVLMERLADQGDGNYFYVDRPAEAARVFRENLTGLLQTIGRETKVQVEFDPRVVSRWRLLGYENRDVADRDFRNDAVDAAEVGAGHQVTALYEVKLTSDAHEPAVAGRAGVVRLRWEAPAHDSAHAGQVTEIEKEIAWRTLRTPESAESPNLRAQALAAEFAEILRGSYWAKESRFADLVPVADAVAAQLPDDAQVQDLRRMIRQAADLQPKE